MGILRVGSSNLKLGIDCREFSNPLVTGVRRHLDQFVRHVVPNLPGRVVLMAPPSALASLPPLAGNMTRVRIAPGPTRLIDQLILPAIAAKTGITTLLSPYYKTPLWGRFRKIITVHDVMFIRHPSFPLHTRLASRLQLALSSRVANRIIVDSCFTRDDLTSLCPFAVDKLDVVYPCLVQQPGTNGKAPAGVPREILNGGPFFLYVGNFKSHKNVDSLINGFGRFLSDTGNKTHQLVLAGGDAHNLPRITRLAESVAPGRIRVLSNLDDSGIRSLYQRAAWFVTASEYEGLCYPVIEAMTFNCPVLFVPVTALPEIVGGCGMPLASPSPESIAKGLANVTSLPESHRLGIMEKGRNRALNFSPDTIRSAFIKALSRLGAL